MSLNLLEIAKGHLNSAVVGKIGGLLGESESATQSAVNGAVPSLLAGLMNKTSSADGAKEVFGMLDDHDGSILGNLDGYLGGGQDAAGLASGSQGMLGSILGGGGLGKVTDIIAKTAGISGGSAGSLLGILAPIVMGILSKQKAASGLDAGGLASLLSSQKSHLSAALPAGMGDSLGLGNILGGAAGSVGSVGDAVGDAAGAVGGAVSGAAGTIGNAAGNAADAVGNVAGAVGDGVGNVAGAAGDAAKAGGGLLGKLLPLIIIGALLLFLLPKLLKKGGEMELPSTPDISMPGIEMPKLELPGMPEIPGVGNFGDKLTGALGGASETLSGITDVESAKAAVPQIEGLTGDIGGLAGHLDKIPGPARGKVIEIVGGLLPQLTGQVDRIKAIPGVGGVVGPAIDGLMSKLSLFGG